MTWCIVRSLFLLMALLIASTSVFAEPKTACVFDSSGIDVQTFGRSKHVEWFKTLQKNSQYAGSLKEFGVFQLRVFACEHRGAKALVLMNQVPASQSLDVFTQHLMRVLTQGLFVQVDRALIIQALSKVDLNALKLGQHFPELAQTLGLSDFSVKLLELNGVYALEYHFYGG